MYSLFLPRKCLLSDFSCRKYKTVAISTISNLRISRNFRRDQYSLVIFRPVDLDGSVICMSRNCSNALNRGVTRADTYYITQAINPLRGDLSPYQRGQE